METRKDRLTERNPDGGIAVRDLHAALDKLAEYEDAEQSGQRMCHIDALHTRAYEIVKINHDDPLSDLCRTSMTYTACGAGTPFNDGKEVSRCAYCMKGDGTHTYCARDKHLNSEYSIHSIFVRGSDILNIGKTVFLTAKEAEAALQVRRETE